MGTEGTAASAGTEASPGVKDRQFVTSLARGLQILSCFSSTQPELSGSDLARLTGLPQPTIWRLCHTMLELGMLIPTTGEKMRPGLPVLRLGNSALAGLDAIELARPHLQDLANRYGAACGLATRQRLDMVFAERCEGRNQLLMNMRRGSAVPIANSALGWAYLAALPTAEREQLSGELEREDGARWKACRKSFQRALAEYEQTGFVMNEGVFHPAYNVTAVPVFNRQGSFYCALNCGSANATLSAAKLRKEVAPKLVALSRMLESGIVLE